MTGFAIAALAGVALGLIAGLSHTVGRALEPVSTVLLGIPPIAWIVLALLWFGSGSLAAIYTVVVTTIPVAFAGAQIGGARTLDQRLQEMGDVFRVPFAMRLWDFYLPPHIVSYVFPALITALGGVAWKVTVMAELFATEDGVGAGMAMARVSLDTAGAMAWIVVVVVLLLVAEHGFCAPPCRKKMEPWRQVKGPAMPAEEFAMLTLQKVSLDLGPNTIVSDVDLQVAPGESLCLVGGPSGCGKTSLLRLASGVLEATSGQVSNHFTTTAAVFQESRLLPWRRLLDNIALGLKAGGVCPPGEID